MNPAHIDGPSKNGKRTGGGLLGLASGRSLKLIVGPDLRILDASPAAAKACAVTREKLLGMDFCGCFTSPEAARFLHACALEKGKTERHLLELKPRRGAAAYLQCEATRQQGDPAQVLVTARQVGLPDRAECKRLQAIVAELSGTDPRTGAMSGKRFEERASIEIMRSDRYGTKLSLVRIGLEGLKGKQPRSRSASNRMLRGFCELARKCHRVNDLFGHWGGDGFVALLPETGPTGAHLFADRLRFALEGLQFEGGVQVTASMGVSGYRENEELTATMGRAETCLSQAKQSGGNCVVDDQEDMQREMAGMLSYPQLINLHWRASYLSGEPLIDAEHKELFRLANRVIAAIAQEGTGDNLLPLVRTLIEHVGAHFGHEEELLKAAAYPMAERHGKTHGRLVERANLLADRFESGEGSAADLLGFLIHDIVASHMLQEDRKFFPWLKAKRG